MTGTTKWNETAKWNSEAYAKQYRIASKLTDS